MQKASISAIQAAAAVAGQTLCCYYQIAGMLSGCTILGKGGDEDSPARWYWNLDAVVPITKHYECAQPRLVKGNLLLSHQSATHCTKTRFRNLIQLLFIDKAYDSLPIVYTRAAHGVWENIECGLHSTK